MELKIQSKIDVITNSSSEVYLVKTNKNPKKLEKELYEAQKISENICCSGMGGDIKVIPPSSDLDSWGYCLDPGYLVVSIDWTLEDVIRYLKVNYEVLQNIDSDPDGPYNEMEKKWVLSKIESLKNEAILESPSRQKEIWKEIFKLQEEYGIKDKIEK